MTDDAEEIGHDPVILRLGPNANQDSRNSIITIESCDDFLLILVPFLLDQRQPNSH